PDPRPVQSNPTRANERAGDDGRRRDSQERCSTVKAPPQVRAFLWPDLSIRGNSQKLPEYDFRIFVRRFRLQTLAADSPRQSGRAFLETVAVAAPWPAFRRARYRECRQ